MSPPAIQPRLLILVTEDWFFASHFMERAVAAREAGYAVTVAARDNGQVASIRAAGFDFVALPFRRSGLNPLRELGTVRAIWQLYRRTKPDVVHHVALKPVLYGTLVALLSGVSGVVNAPVGMGFVFTSNSALSLLLRPVVWLGLKLLLNPPGSVVVLENSDDLEHLVASRLARLGDVRLIEGAGVDLERFAPREEPLGPPVVVLVARMLADKGVNEYVEAARLLRRKGVAARFQLVGDPDPVNPASIATDSLRDWASEGVVEWLGHRSDMPAVLGAAHIACLPSYREGLPKSLLEAMAAGLPIVTTDVPGCRAAVSDGDNGLLVPARDAEALARALERLIGDGKLRRQLGAAGRRRAEARFSSPNIVAQTLETYSTVLR
jgi:glycosyltransferase involved in cell wall biosynthesis